MLHSSVSPKRRSQRQHTLHATPKRPPMQRIPARLHTAVSQSLPHITDTLIKASASPARISFNFQNRIFTSSPILHYSGDRSKGKDRTTNNRTKSSHRDGSKPHFARNNRTKSSRRRDDDDSKPHFDRKTDKTYKELKQHLAAFTMSLCKRRVGHGTEKPLLDMLKSTNIRQLDSVEDPRDYSHLKLTPGVITMNKLGVESHIYSRLIGHPLQKQLSHNFSHARLSQFSRRMEFLQHELYRLLDQHDAALEAAEHHDHVDDDTQSTTTDKNITNEDNNKTIIQAETIADLPDEYLAAVKAKYIITKAPASIDYHYPILESLTRLRTSLAPLDHCYAPNDIISESIVNGDPITNHLYQTINHAIARIESRRRHVKRLQDEAELESVICRENNDENAAQDILKQFYALLPALRNFVEDVIATQVPLLTQKQLGHVMPPAHHLPSALQIALLPHMIPYKHKDDKFTMTSPVSLHSFLHTKQRFDHLDTRQLNDKILDYHDTFLDAYELDQNTNLSVQYTAPNILPPTHDPLEFDPYGHDQDQNEPTGDITTKPTKFPMINAQHPLINASNYRFLSPAIPQQSYDVLFQHYDPAERLMAYLPAIAQALTLNVPDSSFNTPGIRSIILQPNREACIFAYNQTQSLLQSLNNAHSAAEIEAGKRDYNFNAMRITGNISNISVSRLLQSPPDVLITTPTTLVQLIKEADIAVRKGQRSALDMVRVTRRITRRQEGKLNPTGQDKDLFTAIDDDHDQEVDITKLAKLAHLRDNDQALERLHQLGLTVSKEGSIRKMTTKEMYAYEAGSLDVTPMVLGLELLKERHPKDNLKAGALKKGKFKNNNSEDEFDLDQDADHIIFSDDDVDGVDIDTPQGDESNLDNDDDKLDVENEEEFEVSTPHGKADKNLSATYNKSVATRENKKSNISNKKKQQEDVLDIFKDKTSFENNASGSDYDDLDSNDDEQWTREMIEKDAHSKEDVLLIGDLAEQYQKLPPRRRPGFIADELVKQADAVRASFKGGNDNSQGDDDDEDDAVAGEQRIKQQFELDPVLHSSLYLLGDVSNEFKSQLYQGSATPLASSLTPYRLVETPAERTSLRQLYSLRNCSGNTKPLLYNLQWLVLDHADRLCSYSHASVREILVHSRHLRRLQGKFPAHEVTRIAMGASCVTPTVLTVAATALRDARFINGCYLEKNTVQEDGQEHAQLSEEQKRSNRTLAQDLARHRPSQASQPSEESVGEEEDTQGDDDDDDTAHHTLLHDTASIQTRGISGASSRLVSNIDLSTYTIKELLAFSPQQLITNRELFQQSLPNKISSFEGTTTTTTTNHTTEPTDDAFVTDHIDLFGTNKSSTQPKHENTSNQESGPAAAAALAKHKSVHSQYIEPQISVTTMTPTQWETALTNGMSSLHLLQQGSLVSPSASHAYVVVPLPQRLQHIAVSLRGGNRLRLYNHSTFEMARGAQRAGLIGQRPQFDQDDQPDPTFSRQIDDTAQSVGDVDGAAAAASKNLTDRTHHASATPEQDNVANGDDDDDANAAPISPEAQQHIEQMEKLDQKQRTALAAELKQERQEYEQIQRLQLNQKISIAKSTQSLTVVDEEELLFYLGKKYAVSMSAQRKGGDEIMLEHGGEGGSAVEMVRNRLKTQLKQYLPRAQELSNRYLKIERTFSQQMTKNKEHLRSNQIHPVMFTQLNTKAIGIYKGALQQLNVPLHILQSLVRHQRKSMLNHVATKLHRKELRQVKQRLVQEKQQNGDIPWDIQMNKNNNVHVSHHTVLRNATPLADFIKQVAGDSSLHPPNFHKFRIQSHATAQSILRQEQDRLVRELGVELDDVLDALSNSQPNQQKTTTQKQQQEQNDTTTTKSTSASKHKSRSDVSEHDHQVTSAGQDMDLSQAVPNGINIINTSTGLVHYQPKFSALKDLEQVSEYLAIQANVCARLHSSLTPRNMIVVLPPNTPMEPLAFLFTMKNFQIGILQNSQSKEQRHAVLKAYSQGKIKMLLSHDHALATTDNIKSDLIVSWGVTNTSQYVRRSQHITHQGAGAHIVIQEQNSAIGDTSYMLQPPKKQNSEQQQKQQQQQHTTQPVDDADVHNAMNSLSSAMPPSATAAASSSVPRVKLPPLTSVLPFNAPTIPSHVSLVFDEVSTLLDVNIQRCAFMDGKLFPVIQDASDELIYKKQAQDRHAHHYWNKYQDDESGEGLQDPNGPVFKQVKCQVDYLAPIPLKVSRFEPSNSIFPEIAKIMTLNASHQKQLAELEEQGGVGGDVENSQLSQSLDHLQRQMMQSHDGDEDDAHVDVDGNDHSSGADESMGDDNDDDDNNNYRATRNDDDDDDDDDQSYTGVTKFSLGAVYNQDRAALRQKLLQQRESISSSSPEENQMEELFNTEYELLSSVNTNHMDSTTTTKTTTTKADTVTTDHVLDEVIDSMIAAEAQQSQSQHEQTTTQQQHSFRTPQQLSQSQQKQQQQQQQHVSPTAAAVTSTQFSSRLFTDDESEYETTKVVRHVYKERQNTTKTTQKSKATNENGMAQQQIDDDDVDFEFSFGEDDLDDLVAYNAKLSAKKKGSKFIRQGADHHTAQQNDVVDIDSLFVSTDEEEHDFGQKTSQNDGDNDDITTSSSKSWKPSTNNNKFSSQQRRNTPNGNNNQRGRRF